MGTIINKHHSPARSTNITPLKPQTSQFKAGAPQNTDFDHLKSAFLKTGDPNQFTKIEDFE